MALSQPGKSLLEQVEASRSSVLRDIRRADALRLFRELYGVPETSVLEQIAEHARMLLRADAAVCVLLDDGLEWHGAVRCAPPPPAQHGAPTLAETALVLGRPVLVDERSSELASLTDLESLGWRSGAAMPIVVSGVAVGAVMAGRLGSLPWSERERDALTNWMRLEAIRSERQLGERRGREAGEHPRTAGLFDRAPIAMALLDDGGTLQRVNEAFCLLVGRAAESLVGTPGRGFIVPFEGDPSAEFFDQLLAGRRRGYSVERRLLLPDGTERRLVVIVAQLRFDRGARHSYLAVCDDVTAREAVEGSAREREDRIRLAQRRDALSQLAGGIAHEFNNALAAIGGLASLLRDDLDSSDPRRGDAEDILRVTQEASDLTRRLLDLNADRLGERATFDLREVLRAFTAVARRVLPSTIEWQLDLTAEAVRATVDRVQLEQVLLGLVLNARDVMPRGGIVRVTLERTRRSVNGAEVREVARIGVADTGPGVSADLIERLWTPFFSTKPSGTGLGLSLAAVVVREHGGEICLESAAGESAVFAIYLPTAVPAEVSEAAGITEPASGGGGGNRVLLVEDERLVRSTQARLLERAGFRVIAAGDGEEAWRIFSADPDAVAAVVTDLQMPRLAGAELIGRIRKLRPRVPVVVTSAHPADPQDGADLRSDRMARLRKPFSAATLMATLTELLASE